MLPMIPVAKTEIVAGSEILKNDDYKHLRTDDIKPLNNYKIRKGSLSAVNHSRRLEKAFINGGEQAVKNYMDQYRKPKPEDTAV